MPAPHESTNDDRPIELAFDVTKASGQMKSLGLSDRPDPSDNEPASVGLRNSGKPLRRGSQTVFAWIAVPSLGVIILLGMLDIRRVSDSAASPRGGTQRLGAFVLNEQRDSTPSRRIVGYWVSEARDHMVYFGPIDPVTQTGAHTTVSRSDRRANTVRFTVVREETRGDRLVIREEPQAGNPDSEVARNSRPSVSAVPSEAVEVTLTVPQNGKTMTRVDIRDGEPVMTIYHNTGDETTP